MTFIKGSISFYSFLSKYDYVYFLNSLDICYNPNIFIKLVPYIVITLIYGGQFKNINYVSIFILSTGY